MNKYIVSNSKLGRSFYRIGKTLPEPSQAIKDWNAEVQRKKDEKKKCPKS